MLRYSCEDSRKNVFSLYSSAIFGLTFQKYLDFQGCTEIVNEVILGINYSLGNEGVSGRSQRRLLFLRRAFM
jgi:hypothetical protein